MARSAVYLVEWDDENEKLKKAWRVVDILRNHNWGLLGVTTDFLYKINRQPADKCAQCFEPFPDGIYFEFEGRKYCEHDFHVLYAPCCGKCNEFIIGRVIKAMNASWHPECFRCELCSKALADIGFLRNAGRFVGFCVRTT
ncbi:LIM domain protein [Ostertagia ostertagi]